MHNPFIPMHIKLVEAFIKDGRRYLVSQTYKEDKNLLSDESKTAIIMSDYEDINLAQVHLKALQSDKYAAIVDLKEEKHLAKVKEMLGPGSKYVVYSTFIKDKNVIKKHLDTFYSENIRSYINKETNWRVGSGETIYPDLQIIFGELFVILKYAGQMRKFPLADLKKY